MYKRQRQVQPGVYLGRTLLPPEHRGLCINVVNTTATPRTVTAGEWLQQVEVLSDQHERTPATPADTGVVDTLMQQLPDDLNTEQHW